MLQEMQIQRMVVKLFFSRMYVTLYPTVWVRWLVSWSVGWSVGNALFFFWRFLGSYRITAPAQSHATDSAVYTALLHHK